MPLGRGRYTNSRGSINRNLPVSLAHVSLLQKEHCWIKSALHKMGQQFWCFSLSFCCLVFNAVSLFLSGEKPFFIFSLIFAKPSFRTDLEQTFPRRHCEVSCWCCCKYCFWHSCWTPLPFHCWETMPNLVAPSWFAASMQCSPLIAMTRNCT